MPNTLEQVMSGDHLDDFVTKAQFADRYQVCLATVQGLIRARPANGSAWPAIVPHSLSSGSRMDCR